MARRRKNSTAIAADLMFAPMVMAMRMPILAAEAQKIGPPTETIRATTEKMAAFAEGAAAAQITYAKAMWSFWPSVMSGRSPAALVSDATTRAINAGLRPSSREVKSNFQRLSGKSGLK